MSSLSHPNDSVRKNVIRSFKAALYIRVSTHYQIDKDSLPFQREELLNYCKYALGIDDCVVFEDAGYSAKNTDRPDYQKMMARIRDGEFTHLVVWKIDRISRNLLDFANMYEELKKYHCAFVSKNEQFDTSSAMGEAMLKIILIFAELERKLTGERVTSIMYSRAEKGLWNGAPIPIGYKWDADKKYPVIDEEEAKVVLYIYQKYREYKSSHRLAHHLNDLNISTKRGGRWTSKTVSDIIRNPFYKGTYRYNYKSNTGTLKSLSEQIIHEHNHESIVSDEEWDSCNDIMDQNGGTRNVSYLRSNVKHIHIFSIITKCWYCGHTMAGNLDAARSDGYRPSKYYCDSHNTVRGCPNKMITDVTLGPFIFNYMSNMIKASKKIRRNMSVNALERMLLTGPMFENIAGIDSAGLSETFSLITQGTQNVMLQTKKENIEHQVQEVELLNQDRLKYERALERLESLFLYSDDAMSEKDYLIKKREFTSFLDNINNRLHSLNIDEVANVGEADFLQKATYFYVANHLNRKHTIDFRKMATAFDKKILKDFVAAVIDTIIVKDGLVMSITFKNGLTHNFIYKPGASRKPQKHGPDGRFKTTK